MRQATRARARAHAHTQWKPEAKKTPTENNNPEENPEDVKHTNPLTTHPPTQLNIIDNTNFFFENRAVYVIMWKNIVQRGRTHTENV